MLMEKNYCLICLQKHFNVKSLTHFSFPSFQMTIIKVHISKHSSALMYNKIESIRPKINNNK